MSSTITITTYNRETGELGSVRTGADIDLLTHRLREHVGWVLGRWEASSHQVDIATGEVVAKATP